ncbi:MAG: ankyrin repeat domain-containing protein [Bdellovibrionales bacterium]|nr:ankyrin repeat domain-containing protein [Bdellovibrionales bacterium]
MSTITTSLTPLMRACAIGHIEVVQQLLDEGVDVNVRGPRGSTALMFAAGGGHLDVVKILVARGADLSVREDGGWTARMHAEDEDIEVAKFLEEAEKHFAVHWGTA